MSQSAEQDRVFVPADTMRTLVRTIFVHAGVSDAEATRIAERLTGANLRGHDSHGVIRTVRYLEWLRDGKVVAGRQIDIEHENDAMVVADAGYGFGQSVGEQIVDLGIAKAKRVGVAVTALKRAGHLGRIGDWAERAAESGLASVHMVNVRGSLLVAPFGGVERRGSTSPFCAGVPIPGEEPIVLDFATSQVAEGKALVALRGGAALPEGSLILPDGTLTADPAPLYGELVTGRSPNPTLGPGALTGFGGHKGSGLNLMMELLAGALTGSGTSAVGRNDAERHVCNGMLSVFMDVAHFRDMEGFVADVREYVEFVKSSRAAAPDGEVLIAGEKERRTMAERLASGLPLAPQAWQDILGAAESAGVDRAHLDALVAKR